MSKRHKASFILYSLVALVLFAYGLRYYLAADLTSYHAAALGQSLASLTPNQQITFLTLYRVLGSGMVSTAVAMAFLLAGPYRRADPWSRWALTGTGLSFSGLTLYATIAFKAETGIDAPWTAAVTCAAVVVLAHLLDLKKSQFKIP